MSKKKYQAFDDPFDLDLLGEDLDLSDLDLPEPEQPKPPSRPKATASEIVFRSMRDKPDTNRPLQGNYQYVNLLLPLPVAQRLNRMAPAHRMMMQPFMRWVVDQMALLYEDGVRPGDWQDVSQEKKRVPALIAPMMADLLKSWARENRMKFQSFMRWLTAEFMTTYHDQRLQPQEPEEFVPDEAALFHWASLTVEKYSGTGKKKGS
ncbi:MAG: hypothetical protein DWQ04_17025 [Chloroflexi bacterium]|nr:MAG: hypothetical protein DWQ04_17025 [Chloroflexota bacterium]